MIDNDSSTQLDSSHQFLFEEIAFCVQVKIAEAGNFPDEDSIANLPCRRQKSIAQPIYFFLPSPASGQEGKSMKTLGSIVRNAARELYKVEAASTAQQAAEYMAERNIGAVTIVDGERVVGLFSERDLMKRVIAQGHDPKAVTVGEVMTTELVAGLPEDSCVEGISKMRQAKCRHLPVLEGHQFLGLISLRDLLEVEVDEQAEELRMLNTYIHYIPPSL
jgi:CBS domain-containing protein